MKPIGPGGVILQYNISDLGWSAKDWNAILDAYPYRNRPNSAQSKAIENATGTPLAYIRADWFAENASRAPLYDMLLKLPATFAELQIDIDTKRLL
jgi:hypothetical protein